MTLTVTRSVGSRGGVVVRGTATGAAALSERLEVGEPTKITWVGVHFSAAPTTSENLVIRRDADAGAAYDVALVTVNPASAGATDVYWEPDEPFYLSPGDAVGVAFTNTDTKTWALTIVGEAI